MQTYGCFDRPYWNYAITDTPGARWQEGVLTLALLHEINDPDNPYYHTEAFLEWIEAGLDFWTKIQLPSGAFNDLYPNERAYVAAAFPLYAVTETLLLLRQKIIVTPQVESGIYKAAKWLIKNSDLEVANHECGAVAALYNTFILTGDTEFREAASAKMTQLAANQTSEGWLSEYGGADIGYTSLSIDYLAKYWQRSSDPQAWKVVTKAVDFVTHFIHPDLTSGGEYGSRNTEYLIPHGFEILSDKLETANLVAHCIALSMESRRIVATYSFDDKFLVFNGYNYLQAYQDNARDESDLSKLPCYTKPYTHFERSGLVVCNQPDFHLVCNLQKGAALRVLFKKTGKVLNDSGIMIQMHSRTLTSCWLNPDSTKTADKDKLCVEGFLSRPFDNQISPSLNILFRVAQLTLGSTEQGSHWIKSLLRKRIVTSPKISQSRFRRLIMLTDKELTIKDELIAVNSCDKIIVGVRLDSIYGESARYATDIIQGLRGVVLTDFPKKFQRMKLTRIYNASGELCTCTSEFGNS